MSPGVARNQRPSLPPEFYQPQPAWVALWFGSSTVQWFGGGYLTWLVAMSAWPVALKIPVVLGTALVATNGLHLFGWLAHEGIHLALVKSKSANLLLGGLAGSVLLFPAVGLGIPHWAHHRHTNESRDPDTLLQSQHQTLFRRFFLARPGANRAYMKVAIAAALKRPVNTSFRMPFTDDELARHSRFGLALIALWFGSYVAVGMYSPGYALYAFVLPYILLVPVTGIRIYIEHAGTEAGEFKDARSYTSWFYTLALFGNNYHLEHHLYPRVPAYRLPQVHRLLEEQGYLDRFRPPVDSGVLSPLRFASERYPYPDWRPQAQHAGAPHPPTGGSLGNA